MQTRRDVRVGRTLRDGLQRGQGDGAGVRAARRRPCLRPRHRRCARPPPWTPAMGVLAPACTRLASQRLHQPRSDAVEQTTRGPAARQASRRAAREGDERSERQVQQLNSPGRHVLADNSGRDGETRGRPARPSAHRKTGGAGAGWAARPRDGGTCAGRSHRSEHRLPPPAPPGGGWSRQAPWRSCGSGCGRPPARRSGARGAISVARATVDLERRLIAGEVRHRTCTRLRCGGHRAVSGDSATGDLVAHGPRRLVASL